MLFCILLQKHLGSLIFQEDDRIRLLQQLLLNSSHPSLSAPVRLLYLDWLSDYLVRRPETAAYVQNVSSFLPGNFDGPETHLRKLKLLSSVLKNKKGNLIHTSKHMSVEVRKCTRLCLCLL
jgi:hypothetical protein